MVKDVRQSVASLGLTLILGASACFAAPAQTTTQAVADANTSFGLRLLQETCRKDKTQNVFLSPFSISQALTMTLNGAGGQTQMDIAQTLGLSDLPMADVNRANEELLASLTAPEEGVELTVANALWADNGITFNPDFRRRVGKSYGADLTTLDLRGPDGAPTINAWVKTHTKGHIERLVSREDLLNADAVLTNAVYFHGNWETPFNPDGTNDAPFTRADGTHKTVPLMSRVGDMDYAETDAYQAVGLPYGSGRLRMVLLLPKSPVGLDAVLASLDGSAWKAALAQLKPARLALFLPRFKADSTLKLKEPLTALGMGSAFQPGADFRPMGLKNANISDVLHKAVLEVNEKGTTAAAATAVIQSRGIGPLLPTIKVRADHPFLFTVCDKTGTLLFAGAIRDPQ